MNSSFNTFFIFKFIILNEWFRLCFMMIAPHIKVSSQKSIASFMSRTSNTAWNIENLLPRDKLDLLVDVMVSTACMNTVKYYNLEFRNEVDHQFASKFKNYGQEGFTKCQPSEYIDSMIRSEKQFIKVIMNPPKRYVTNVPANRLKFARLQYLHTIEPRKVAHQIITVRDDISNEILSDLNCFKLENDEIERYCQLYTTESQDVAEKSRRDTFSIPSGSTPYRENNYFESSSLITSLAFDAVRVSYINSKNHVAAAYMEEVLEHINIEHKSKTIEDQILSARSMPRRIMEEMLSRGLTNGILEKSGISLNTLKIAQLFMEARLALGAQASECISEQARYYRRYFGLIKELGGFSRLDFSKPKMEVVYMDEIEREEAQRKKEENELMMKANESTNSNDNDVVQDEMASNDLQNTIASASDVNDANVWRMDDNFGNFGPMSM